MGPRLTMLAVLVAASCAAPAPPVASITPRPPEALPEVEVHPLGEVHGDWAIVLRAWSGYGGLDEGELWAVPLDGGDAKLVVGWSAGGIGGYGIQQGLTVVARQLSPDARRIVLAVTKYPRGAPYYGTRLATIDLFSGAAEGLDTPNVESALRPAWSPDGRRIAFDRYGGTFWIGMSVIGADGTGFRGLCDASIANEGGFAAFHGCYGLDGWTPDGKGVRFYEVDGYSVIDAGSGQLTRFRLSGASLVASTWRAGSPAVAIAVIDGGVPRVVTAEADGSRQRVVVSDPPRTSLDEPRWSPRGDDLLVHRRSEAAGDTLSIVSPDGLSRVVARGGGYCLQRGEWHPNGADVVFIRACGGERGEVRIAHDGAERVLWTPPDDGRRDARLIDLAVVHYR